MVALPETVTLTERAIRSAQEAAQVAEHRTYLGASVIGDECSRKLWYAFRWAHEPERFDGRKLSIFTSGHLWEDRLVGLLQGAGLEVDAIDPTTGEQFAIRFAGGHAGGHTDGKARGVPDAPKTVHVLECKSHNDKSFKELKRLRVKAAKPAHYAQMQTYMHHQGLERALYVAVNKNDDDLYIERVEYDPAYAHQLVAKAERIVQAEAAPPRAFEDPASKLAWGCSYCPAKGLCHDGHFAERNCRTCLHSTPVMDGEGRWRCERWNRVLTADDQRAGCPKHLFLPDLVPGDQIDADEETETVAYLLTRGDFANSEWADGVAGQGPRSEISA